MKIIKKSSKTEKGVKIYIHCLSNKEFETDGKNPLSSFNYANESYYNKLNAFLFYSSLKLTAKLYNPPYWNYERKSKKKVNINSIQLSIQPTHAWELKILVKKSIMSIKINQKTTKDLHVHT